MKLFTTTFAVALAFLLLVACAPTDEEQIAAIENELMNHFDCSRSELNEYLNVRIGSKGGEKAYIVDTEFVLNEYNFIDGIEIYSGVLGCIHRAIDSGEGISRMGFTTLWLDMDMSNVHRLAHISESGDSDEFIDALDEYIEFVDR